LTSFEVPQQQLDVVILDRNLHLLQTIGSWTLDRAPSRNRTEPAPIAVSNDTPPGNVVASITISLTL